MREPTYLGAGLRRARDTESHAPANFRFRAARTGCLDEARGVYGRGGDVEFTAERYDGGTSLMVDLHIEMALCHRSASLLTLTPL